MAHEPKPQADALERFRPYLRLLATPRSRRRSKKFPGPGLGADPGGQLLGGMVRFDAHGGLLPGNRQHPPTAPPQEVISPEPYESVTRAPGFTLPA